MSEEVEMVDGRARVYHDHKGVVTPSHVGKAKASLPQGKKWSFDSHGHDGKRPYMDFVHVKEEAYKGQVHLKDPHGGGPLAKSRLMQRSVSDTTVAAVRAASERRKQNEEADLDEAVKLGTKVKIHAPGKDYHDKVGHVGEVRHGAFKGCLLYTSDAADE